MKHRTAIIIDWFILKPIAVFYCPYLVLYGFFSSKGSGTHIFLGIMGIVITSIIGQSLYPKATPSDIATGRAWSENGPDNEKQGQEINVDIQQIKIRHDNNDIE